MNEKDRVNRVICPYCGYRMPIEVASAAVAKGLFVKCKGRRCGKRFEIIIPSHYPQQSCP
jgi:DNA-directed RNA polymerase subunit RPC12/RpoP